MPFEESQTLLLEVIVIKTPPLLLLLPVSYTHLDVYKRQGQNIRRQYVLHGTVN